MAILYPRGQEHNLGTVNPKIMLTNLESLNAICPYFTMFPLSFPRKVLSKEEGNTASVLDPFCGRGTTNMAARLKGLASVGIDSHPLAVALTKAKLVSTTPKAVLHTLDQILEEEGHPEEMPSGEFWNLAFEESTLASLMKVRNALVQNCRSSARIALRAIVLGALHGPVSKGNPSYFSNQCPRTYAPKPRYAVSFWRKHDLRPQKVDIRDVIECRAIRFYGDALPESSSQVLLGDSRDSSLFSKKLKGQLFDWVVTSPPYYGLRTYRPDQWLRLWFLGGQDTVDYSQHEQIIHSSPEDFANQLSKVWRNCASVCKAGARLVIRFGRIPDRNADPVEILRASLSKTDWRVQTRCNAGSASIGKRQAGHFGIRSTAFQEFDLWAVKA